MQNEVTEAQRKEELASEQVAALQEQLKQQAAETQHCNARAEVAI